MQHALPTSFGWLGKKTALTFIVLFSLCMTLTGLIALYEGATRFMQPFVSEGFAATAGQQVTQLRQQPTLENLDGLSKELGNMARLTSVERFVDSRLPEHGLYYATMPAANQVLLAAHIILGVFCLLVGGFQFWPQFRKRFMKLHRLFGALYVVTAPVSVVLSLVYLALTPPHHIYAHLVAWFALWLFGLLAIAAIVMAVRALRARRLHEHQAWMALSLGCLIVAPMLRWNWVLLGLAFPQIDQETLNLVTMVIMLPEVLLIGYALTLINRQYQRAMVRRPAAPIATRSRRFFLAAMPLWFALAAVTIAINTATWVFADGTLSLAPEGLIPGTLTEQESTAFQGSPGLGWLLTLGFAAALWLGLTLLKSLLAGQAERINKPRALLFTASCLLTAALAFHTGAQIGLTPNLTQFSGGTLYSLIGFLLTLFSLFFLGSYLSANTALMKESLVFLLATLPFNALLLASLWLVHGIALPADYLIAGQGYVLPAGASTGLFFVAMLYVVFGQATREHG
tara:strand:- start:735 stop:2273 length:1539 start_codon:yes stop_codon:yes gene_type:complete